MTLTVASRIGLSSCRTYVTTDQTPINIPQTQGKKAVASWPYQTRRATDKEIKAITTKRRSTSLTNSRPATFIEPGMETFPPNVITQNRFGILAECLLNDMEHIDEPDNGNTVTRTHQNPSTDQGKIKPSPIYIHGNINYQKLLEALKTKYNERFHAKYTADKLKVIFQNIKDFKEFKELCRKDNIQFHTYIEKVLIVVLKGLVKLPDRTIINNLKRQGLNPLHRNVHTHQISYLPNHLCTRYDPSESEPGKVYRKSESLLGEI